MEVLNRQWVSWTIAFTPLLAYWLSVEFGLAPPFWHDWNHWELTFYYTAMDLVDGLPIHMASNPGLPVQYAGYLVLKAIGTEPSAYPQFLRIVHGLTLTSVLATGYLFQRVVFDGSNRILSVACIWLYFSSGAALTYLQVWAPEAFYFPLGILFIVALVRMLDRTAGPSDLQVLAAAACLAVLVALKFNFLAWLPAFGVVMVAANLRRPVRTQIRQLLLAGLAWVTTFLLVTRPSSDNYGYMADFLLGFARTDGTASPIPKTDISFAGVIANWGAVALDAWAWILLTSVLLVIFYRYGNDAGMPKAASKRTLGLLLLFAMLAVVFSLASVTRIYYERYMLPAGLCALLACTAAARAKAAGLSGKNRGILIGFSFIALFVAMGLRFQQTRAELDELHGKNSELQAALDHFVGLAAKQPPVIVYGWPVPLAAAAMRHQPYYEAHQRALDALYPDAGFKVPWRDYVRIPHGRANWDLAVFPVASIAALRASRTPIVNDIDGGKPVAYFENFEVLETVGQFAILAPLGK